MGLASARLSLTFTPSVDHGGDVKAEGWGIVRQDRLNQLVRQFGPVGDWTFEIEFRDPGYARKLS